MQDVPEREADEVDAFQPPIIEGGDAGLAEVLNLTLLPLAELLLDDACELGLIASNPAQRLRNLPPAPSPRPRAWTFAQVQQFIAYVGDDRWYPLWRFLAVTGVRRGEALGLRWDACTSMRGR